MSEKRKRRVTTCRECHRRKQKCDRRFPCNFCLRRGIPNECVYEDTIHGNSSSSASSPRPHLETDVLLLPEPKFSDQVGYLDLESGSALNDLLKSLPNADHSPNGHLHPADIHSGYIHEYTAITAQLPSHAISHELARIFFSEANWHFQILERYYFYKLHNSWLRATLSADNIKNWPRDVLYFPALLFQVLAVALQFLPSDTTTAQTLRPDETPACEILSQRYSSLGTKLMSLLGQQNSTIIGVQHDLMRSLWLKNTGRGTVSWHTLGSALRQAQAQGFHALSEIRQSPGEDVRDALSRAWEAEHKKRLWVTLFTWDSHMAMILGRPRSINLSDCSTKLPIQCDIPDDPSNVLPIASGIHEKPCLYATRLFSYAIGIKIHEMLSMGANKRHIKEYKIVRNLHAGIETLLQELHPALRPKDPDMSWDSQFPRVASQREYVKILANSFLLALHREHAVTHEESHQAAVSAALESLDAQERLFPSLGANQYSIYALSCHSIDACIFLAYILIQKQPLDRNLVGRACSSLHKAAARLKLMEKRSQLAKKGSDILSTILQRLDAQLSATDLIHSELGSSQIPIEYFQSAPLIEEDVSAGLDSASQNFLDHVFLSDRFQPDFFENWDPMTDEQVPQS